MLLIPDASISTNDCVFWASAIALLIVAQTFISTDMEILTENLDLAFIVELSYNQVDFLKTSISFLKVCNALDTCFFHRGIDLHKWLCFQGMCHCIVDHCSDIHLHTYSTHPWYITLSYSMK